MMSRGLLVLALCASVGCTSAPPRRSPAADAAIPAAQVDTAEVCVLERGNLASVSVELQPAGDTTVGGRPFSQVYGDTGQYAATRDWYVGNEPIDYDPQNVCYVKFGRARYVAAESLVRLGEWRGVPVFRERSETGLPGVIWVPVGPGCSFQPYQYMPSAPPQACPQPEYRFEVP